MSEARVNNLSNESNTGGPTISGITTFSGTNYFVPPVGNTAQRPENPQKGAIRFNTDSKHLEYYRGDNLGWSEVEASNDELGGGTGSNTGTGTRLIAFGGGTPTATDTINFLTIPILGNAQDFGDLNHAENSMSAISDSTRILCVGGASAHPGPHVNIIEKITISSTGDGTDFGDTTTDCAMHAYGGGNSTRGVYGGSGVPANVNNLEYITIQSEGNGVDFGDTVKEGQYRRGNAASTTRGVIMGLYAPGGDGHSNWNTIEYITIASTGDAQDFGDLTQTSSDATSTSNAIRALRIGKWPVNGTVDYVTIATLGNAIDFGDMNVAAYHTSAASNPTRAVKVGGNESPGATNSCEFFTIMTTGNGQDFGDLAYTTRGVGANSNGHGGL